MPIPSGDNRQVLRQKQRHLTKHGMIVMRLLRRVDELK
jgi:hypothetical protein